MEFFTTGVYNSEESDFFERLTKNNIDTFADIRQRRGVRGKRYAFANSRRLQHKLQELGIRYEHVMGLAPTTEIRQVQENSDKQLKKSRRERMQLTEAFKEAYSNLILTGFDFENYLQELSNKGAEKIVLFCVEEHAEACHRSLAAQRLETLGYKVTHL